MAASKSRETGRETPVLRLTARGAGGFVEKMMPRRPPVGGRGGGVMELQNRCLNAC